MNIRRRPFLASCSALIGMPFAGLVQAQSEPKMARIGFLSTATAASFSWRVDAMKDGLRELGYVEGKNIVIEYRWAEFDNNRLPALAADLVRSKVDVIVTAATPATLAAKKTTSTIPIVMTTVGDAVASGVVASLARPEANVTGVTFLLPQLSAKRLEIIKEVNPRISKVAAFHNGANKIGNDPVIREMEVAAKSLRMDLQRAEVWTTNEFESAFAVMARGGVEAVVVGDDTLISTNPKVIADLAMKYRIASIGFTELADAGGLMAYGVSRPELFRRIAYFVDRVLKGAKPGDMPVELPTKFELIANMKTALALGLKIPNAILIRADRVIE